MPSSSSIPGLGLDGASHRGLLGLISARPVPVMLSQRLLHFLHIFIIVCNHMYMDRVHFYLLYQT